MDDLLIKETQVKTLEAYLTMGLYLYPNLNTTRATEIYWQEIESHIV